MHFSTSKASVVLVPDADEKKNGELTKATVTVDGKFSLEGVLRARCELMKVLLRNAPKGAKIIDRIGLMPDTYEEIAMGEEVTNAGKPMRGITVTGSARYLIPYGKMHDEPLRINVDSDSPAIFCYYYSMRRNNPVDGFREMFKIIEYFCGVREAQQSDKERIIAGLERTWWIPVEALDLARKFVKNENMTSTGLANHLIDLRGKCSHMRPDYGLTPTDLYGQARLTEMSIVLDIIVRHSMERNPETKDGNAGGGRS